MTHTKIKICGITDPEMAVEAARAGADYIGIMRASVSPRYVTLELAKAIAAAAIGAKAIPVLVYTDNFSTVVNHECEELNVAHVQLHGDVARQTSQSLKDFLHRIHVLEIAHNGQVLPHTRIGSEHLLATRDFLLMDGEHPGSGQQYDYRPLNLSSEFRYFIAGGLTPANVGHVIQQLTPYAVDVSSGVEIKRGVKDIHLIREFIQAVYEVDYAN